MTNGVTSVPNIDFKGLAEKHKEIANAIRFANDMRKEIAAQISEPLARMDDLKNQKKSINEVIKAAVSDLLAQKETLAKEIEAIEATISEPLAQLDSFAKEIRALGGRVERIKGADSEESEPAENAEAPRKSRKSRK